MWSVGMLFVGKLDICNTGGGAVTKFNTFDLSCIINAREACFDSKDLALTSEPPD